MLKKLTLAALLIGPLTALSQTAPCDVAVDSLKGTYVGECKNGLAHGFGTAEGQGKYTGEFKKGKPDGMGTYTWKNGAYYSGNWKKGQQDGRGEMHFASADSATLIGYWKKGNYSGQYEKPWVFYNLPNLVLNNTVRKIDNNSNTLIIKMESGVNGRAEVSRYTVLGGNYLRENKRQQGVVEEIEFQQVVYPFRIRFETQGGTLDLEVFEKGNWEVYIKF